MRSPAGHVADLIVAATARACRVPLCTLNPADFHTEGLEDGGKYRSVRALQAPRFEIEEERTCRYTTSWESYPGCETFNPETRLFNRKPFDLDDPAHSRVATVRCANHITDDVLGRVEVFRQANEADPKCRMSDSRCVMAPWLLLLFIAQTPVAPPLAASPSLASGETLTLSEAVARARARSPFAAAARAQAEGAARAAKVAGRLADPILDLTMENWRPGASDFEASTDLDTFAVVTQPLDLFTRSGRKAEAGGESDEASAGRLRAEQDVQLDTVRSYLEVWRGRELVAALEAQEENLQSIVAAMKRRVDEGYAAEADLLRFRAEAARAANQLARARIEHERVEAELTFLVGRPVAGLRLEKPDIPTPPSGEPEALAERALQNRPDVAAARARATRTQGALSLEHARRYPDLAFTGGYKRTTGLDTAVVGLVTTVPLFERNGRAVALAEGEAQAAELELAATLDRARAEAAILIRAARALQERLSRLDMDLVQPAEEARRSTLAAFREGAADVLRVVDAERTNTDARREALDLTVEAFLAGCRARLAAGLEVLP